MNFDALLKLTGLLGILIWMITATGFRATSIATRSRVFRFLNLLLY